MRHLHHIRFAWHGLTAQGVRLHRWRDVGELADGRFSVAALVRTIDADLRLCHELDRELVS